MCTCAWRAEASLRCHSSVTIQLVVFGFEAGSLHGTHGLLISLGWLGRNLGCSWFHVLSAGIPSTHHCTQLFTWVLEIEFRF